MISRLCLLAALCAILSSCGQNGHIIGESSKTRIKVDEVTNIPLGIKKGDTLSICLRKDLSDGEKGWYLNTGYKVGDTVKSSNPYSRDVVIDTKLYIAE